MRPIRATYLDEDGVRCAATLRLLADFVERFAGSAEFALIRRGSHPTRALGLRSAA